MPLGYLKRPILRHTADSLDARSAAILELTMTTRRGGGSRGDCSPGGEVIEDAGHRASRHPLSVEINDREFLC
jgi:hypothetical protein